VVRRFSRLSGITVGSMHVLFFWLARGDSGVSFAGLDRMVLNGVNFTFVQ